MADRNEGASVASFISLQDQIAEVKREILMRRRVYISMIKRRQITPEEAQIRTERMLAVQRTLERLRAGEVAGLKQMA